MTALAHATPIASLRARQVSLRESPKSPWPQCIEQSQLFADIPVTDRAEILSAAQLRKFPSCQTIYFAGDTIREILFLTEGSVKITQIDEIGREAILRILGPGDLVGRSAVGKPGKHLSEVLTRQDCAGLVWSLAEFEALSNRFPTIRRNTIQILERHLDGLEIRFHEICTTKVSRRLARELMRLTGLIGTRNNTAVSISISREELAQLTATTIFTVSRLLSRWERKGIVGLKRLSVEVINPKSLASIAELE
jgi:CRP-like cAMP-binding protein